MVKTKLMKDVQEGYEIERNLVKTIDNMRDARKMGHGEFARAVFGDSKSSETKWTRIVKQSQTGKPQSLSVRDAYALSKFFGLQLHTLLAGISSQNLDKLNPPLGSIQ